MAAVLITQCLQNDFVAPLAESEPLPNLLHIGHRESARLLGADPATGPVAQLIRWAREQPAEALHVLHIRDWHDPADPRQRPHLDRFGDHCLQGNAGADLVFGAADDEREALVDTTTLSDFEDSRLPRALAQIRDRDGAPLRVAVIGVWTEAKVSYLCYDLLTRGGVAEVATCSALTASASRAQHFNALGQLQSLLGVRVLDTVGQLCEWLCPDASAPAALAEAERFAARLAVRGADVTQRDHELLGLLYRDARALTLDPLSGGFSGASVFRVGATDALGHDLAPTVAKLGPRELIGKERVAFEAVEPILGNAAPTVLGFTDLGDRAAIKYAYASMGDGAITTFKSLYEDGASDAQVESVLRGVFDGVLGRFTRAARLDRLSLLDHYGFEPRFADRVRANVDRVLGREGEPALDRIDVGGGLVVANPARFYSDVLPSAPSDLRDRVTSYLHGDLNGANILVDAPGNVWLIDFFHAQQGHALRDLIKLENDLLFIFTPLADEDELAQAHRVTGALARIEDLTAPLAEQPPEGVRAPGLARAWRTLRVLRSFYPAIVADDPEPSQQWTAGLRYAAHTMTFDESSPLHKRWALGAAGLYAEALTALLGS